MKDSNIISQCKGCLYAFQWKYSGFTGTWGMVGWMKCKIRRAESSYLLDLSSLPPCWGYLLIDLGGGRGKGGWVDVMYNMADASWGWGLGFAKLCNE